MRSVYLFSTLAVMVSGVLSSELTGVMFTFYSGPDEDGDTHTIGATAYTPDLETEGNLVIQKDGWEDDHGPMESVHINQLTHFLFHDDESYCIQTWQGGWGAMRLYSYNWSTADDDVLSEHPLYDHPDTVVVTKGACDDNENQPPPDKAWPKKS